MCGNRDVKYGLDFDRVSEVLSYDPKTGIFRWKVKLSDRSPIGKIAGGYACRGHWRIRIDGHYYFAHRLAWLMTHGMWPKDEIDHINRVRDDNRLANLREASHSQNHANCGVRQDNTSGYKGVHFSKQKGKFAALVVKHGKRHHAGFFDDPYSAHLAYLAKAKELHGDFHSSGA
jgi:hypothetical protein